MARGVNKAILIGNLGADPETRYTAGGTAVTNCNIATSEQWTDKNSGEKQERTEWHRLVFFARLAEVAGEFLSKGSKIYVEGKIQTRKWQNNEGQDVYTTEIVVNDLQMLDSKGGDGGGQAKAEQQARQYRGPASNRGGFPQQHGQQQQPAAAGSGPGFDDDLDDEIPF